MTWGYHLLFRTVFVRMDPEWIHERALGAIRTAERVPLVSHLTRAIFRKPKPVAIRGLHRPVPGRLGLAAGMDKNASVIAGMDMLGFGFVEVGTITAHPQPGNEPPRLWRELDLTGLRNRMGFNNAGAVAAGAALRALRGSRRGRSIVVGANLGKSKITPLAEAAEDYARSAREVAPWADYLVVNVSSPNTPGLRDLQAVEHLKPILTAVQQAADDAAQRDVPLFVKVAPDLSDEDLDAVAQLVLELGLTGMVAVNTTIDHDLGPGGLSGAPLHDRALRVVARLRSALGPEPVIIGAGGLTTEAQARAMLFAGADLLQAYSAFIYEGPAWPSAINRALG